MYWCTADIGWITGHSYIIYGPLAAGATTVMFEGIPSYPDYGRFWEICEKLKVTHFYTAPTAIRSLGQTTSEICGRTMIFLPSKFWEVWENLLMKKPGTGIMIISEKEIALLWIPGGKPKPALS